MKESIKIMGIRIYPTSDGLYSLRDVWTVNGRQPNKQANSFLTLDSTHELVEVLANRLNLEKNQILRLIYSWDGHIPYAHQDLVYAYAMWVNPGFLLSVISDHCSFNRKWWHIVPNKNGG